MRTAVKRNTFGECGGRSGVKLKMLMIIELVLWGWWSVEYCNCERLMISRFLILQLSRVQDV